MAPVRIAILIQLWAARTPEGLRLDGHQNGTWTFPDDVGKFMRVNDRRYLIANLIFSFHILGPTKRASAVRG
jgi:hypothetical protein